MGFEAKPFLLEGLKYDAVLMGIYRKERKIDIKENPQ